MAEQIKNPPPHVSGYALPASAEAAPATRPAPTPAHLRWWREGRFGLFIHWGPVSLQGTEIGWSRGAERCGIGGKGEVPVEIYDHLYERFNPTNFKARQWAQLAKSTGMRYVVLTAKHCDGFCLWPTKSIEHHIGRTPFRRDVCGELATAVRQAGLHMGWYYSPMDWFDPDCRSERNSVYLARMQTQLREILGQYGRIDLLWFDTDGGSAPWDQPATYRLVKNLQPNIIINNRLDMGSAADYNAQRVQPPADYFTPEQAVGAYADQIPWETCMTLGTQWAWKPGDTIKSAAETMSILARCAGGDGNLLLNVGPMPSGQIEPRQVEVLQSIGAWLKKYGESIYGTRGGPFKPTRHLASTRKGKTIYLHFLQGADSTVLLPVIPARVASSRVLGGGGLRVRQTAEGIEVSVPENELKALDTVVALKLDRDTMQLPAQEIPRSVSLTTGAKASASNVYQQQAEYDPSKAVDDNDDTRWATDGGLHQAWLELDLGRVVTFNRARLTEAFPNRVQKFQLQHLVGEEWTSFCTGTTIGDSWTRRFAPVSARRVRLNVEESSDGPTIWEFQLFAPAGEKRAAQ